MTGLKIVSSTHSTIQWIYKGQAGSNEVTSIGTVLAAFLFRDDFKLGNTTANRITQACQRWRDRESGGDDSPRRFKVKVVDGTVAVHYNVLAYSEEDARVLAYALDGGLKLNGRPMQAGHIDLVIANTEMVT